MKVGIDTNILVYSVDLADPVRQNRAIEVISRAARTRGAVADQSFFEFLHVVIRKFGFARSGAFQMVKVWRGLFETVTATDAIFEDTEALMQRFNLGIWDSKLIATLEAAEVSVLLSEDMQDGGQYGGVLVVDPFKRANESKLDSLLSP